MSLNVAVTIRIPLEQLHLIDEYAHKIGNSRSDVLRASVNVMADEIQAIERKEQLIKASKKASAANLLENLELTETLEDGLN